MIEPEVQYRRAGEDKVTELLFDKGTLFHLFIGRWTGNKKMNERDLLLEEVDKAAIYLGHKKLLPPEAQHRLQNIEGQARIYLANRSIPFLIANARFVSYHVLQDVLARLNAFKAQFEEAKVYLLQNYPRFKDEQLVRLAAQSRLRADQEIDKVPHDQRAAKRREMKEWEEEQAKLNASLYPSIDDLRSKYVFQWRMFKVSAVEGMEQMSAVQASTILEEQQRIQDDFRQWVREASGLIHQELGQAASQVKRLLEENGKLSARSLKPLFEAFDTFQAVNFAGTSEFQRMIDQVRSRYLVKGPDGSADYRLAAEVVNRGTDELRGMLNTLSELAIADTANQAGIRSVRGGDFGRVIDL
jgi:hypothetical protein